MHCFEIHLNGERLCLAGIEGNGVLTAIVDDVLSNSSELHLTVGALVGATREQLTWTNTELKVGDEVTVKIVESETADEPQTRAPADPARDLRAQKAYVRRMAEHFGWRLDEHPQ